MHGLLSKPDGPVSAFWQGAIATFAALLGPIAAMVIIRSTPGQFIGKAATGLTIVAVMSVLAGLACAAWALVQGRAYREVTTKDDAWGS